MVISEKYRYLFIEVPHTGSTSISKELRTHYGGRRILNKHSTYGEFLKQCTREQKEFCVFAAKRNPLDIIVTRYFKLKTDHDNFKNDPQSGRINDNRWVQPEDLEHFEFIQRNDATFEQYFRRFHLTVYNNFYLASHRHFDMVMRFENLREDFAAVLERLGITPVGDLPHVNRTNARNADFLSYYDSPELRRQAVEFYGPFMRKWGYTVPEDWPATEVPRLNRIRFHTTDMVANLVNAHLGWGPSFSNPYMRRMRSLMRAVWA